MVCGIYQIKNLTNNKSYVGQSINIKKRYREHIFSSMHITKDSNSPIHKAIKKYGHENFQLIILEECAREQLNIKEQFWINKLNTYQNGYNATLGGDTDSHYNGKEVELYDLNGKYVTSFPTVTMAAEALKVNRSTIYQILQGYRLSCKGYQFKYKNSNKQIMPYASKQGGKIPVVQLNKDTKEQIAIFESAIAAARAINGDPSCITKVCKNKLKTHKGYG